jgi:hypothetical protein
MDPLLAAAAISTTATRLSHGDRLRDEDAFYRLHGGRVLRRAVPAAPAIAVAIAVVVLTGVFGA